MAVLFSTQQTIIQASNLLAINSGNGSFKTNLTAAVVNGNIDISELELVSLELTNLLKNCKGFSEKVVQVSNG